MILGLSKKNEKSYIERVPFPDGNKNVPLVKENDGCGKGNDKSILALALYILVIHEGLTKQTIAISNVYIRHIVNASVYCFFCVM